MQNKKAVLICFNVRSERFDSNYERNKFFRGLYGWKQMIKKETADGKEKTYVYERDGLLDEIPHKKVDQSSFFIDNDDADEIFRFFDEWADKVMLNAFKVILEDNIFE
jgi:hypothetical protein